MTVDSTNDNSLTHLYHISKVTDLPDFVKSASLPTLDEVKDLPHTAFADCIKRKFPVHTKAACYLSYAYFLKQKNKLSKEAADRIGERFNALGKFWKIAEELEELRGKFNPKTEKVASTEGCFALVVNNAGTSMQLFPVDTPEHVIKSAEELLAVRDKLTYPMRKQAAHNIMVAATNHNVNLGMIPDNVHRMAGFGITVKEAALNQLNRRINYAKTAEQKKAAEQLKKVADLVEKQSEAVLLPGTLEKIASSLDIFDRYTGISDLYGTNFDYPEDTLFQFTKSAAEKVKNEVVAMTNGSSYWLSDLSKAAEAFDILGDLKGSMTSFNGHLDLHKVAEIVPTLPRNDADMLDKALATVGVPKAALNKEAMVRRVLQIKKAEKKEEKKQEKPETKEHRAAMVKIDQARNTMSKLKARATNGKYMAHAPNKSQVKVVSKDE